jgi:hypothetical protein
MHIARIHLLSRKRLHKRVLHSAKLLPHLHPSLVKPLDPIFHFVAQTPLNICHLPLNVLEHHMHFGGDGALENFTPLNCCQNINLVSYYIYIHWVYSPCQQKCSVPQNKHLTKMQAKRFNFRIQQQAVISLPLLEYQGKLVKYMESIIHYLFDVFAIQTPPMVRT